MRDAPPPSGKGQDRGLKPVPSYSGAKQSIIDQIPDDSGDSLDGVQFLRAKAPGRFALRHRFAITNINILKLDAGNDTTNFVKEIERHRDHRISHLLEFLV